VAIIEVKDRRGADLWAESLQQLERDEILPRYLLEQRWYGSKSEVAPLVRIERSIPVGLSARMLVLAVTAEQEVRHYFLPVCAAWDVAMPTNAIVELHSGSNRGWLIDAFSDDDFVRSLLRGIFTASSEAAADGLLYKRSPSFDPLPHFADKVEIKRPRAEQSNTSILAGDAILKAFRRLENGIHPEVEVGTFLTDTARFPNVPHLLGIIEHRLETDERVVLCVLQRLVENSTDGWNYVAGELGRLSDRAAPNEPTARLLSVAQKLGARTADLHRAFASGTDSAFAPEKISEQWLMGWSLALVESVGAVYARLQDQRPPAPPRKFEAPNRCCPAAGN
jgi:trehalose synthase-fused probable maltokinase